MSRNLASSTLSRDPTDTTTNKKSETAGAGTQTQRNGSERRGRIKSKINYISALRFGNITNKITENQVNHENTDMRRTNNGSSFNTATSFLHAWIYDMNLATSLRDSDSLISVLFS
ncbi:hypothetical protein SLA2020_310810 [Shorea laevis]